LRIVEEWGLVDRISGGRVGVSFATGFHPLDFVLAPDRYARRREEFLDAVNQVRELWRGAEYRGPAPGGGVATVVAYPGGVQPELPFWFTAAASDETFRMAGASGANLLTAMLTISEAQLTEKIQIYRTARREAGYDPDTGRVTLMVHTHVGADGEDVRELCREPFRGYLLAHTDLVDSLTRTLGEDVSLDKASVRDRDAILGRAFHSFYEHRSLMGNQSDVAARLRTFSSIGVDEVAALVDFGLDTTAVLDSLRRLHEVVDQPPAG
jgi:natural product biosynthesis luciferase-like monooxygenase protein